MSKPQTPHGDSISRRQFIYYSALAASGTALTGYAKARPRPVSPNEKLNIAGIGAGGKGSSDLNFCSGENIVALCDVNESSAGASRQKFPNAKFYTDFRVMLEKEKSIDAVDIATPDHMHAAIAAMAIKMGKHVYCQKPLTHDVYEARKLRDLAREYKVATQMGNQGSASDSLRRAVEVVQAGLIGPVRQAYVWTNRPVWPQGMERPAGEDSVPDGVHWDLWLGTAPWRPYKASWPQQPPGGRRGVYQPWLWRGWLDFGTGALGDMACHTVNWPFRALNLEYPTEIEAESSGLTRDMYPKNSKIRFEFPARHGQPPVTLWWLDGGNKPPKEITADVAALLDQVSGSGCLMIGDKGQVFSPDDGDQDLRLFVKLNGEKELTRGSEHEAVKAIPQTLVRNAFKGAPDQRQHLEWIAACKGGPPGTPISMSPHTLRRLCCWAAWHCALGKSSNGRAEDAGKKCARSLSVRAQGVSKRLEGIVPGLGLVWMIWIRGNVWLCAVSLGMVTGCATAPKSLTLADVYSVLQQKRFVDLTHAFEPGIPHWPGFPNEQRETLYWYEPGKGKLGAGFFAEEYRHVGQWGTHVDSPAHFVKGLRTVDQIDVREMILPFVVIDVHEKVAKNPDYTLSRKDIEAWEAKHGLIPHGCFVAMRTDWSRRWPDMVQMQNKDSKGVAHYPGWSLEALKYLYEERHITASGHETTDTDPGFAASHDDYSLETYVLKGNHYQIELLAGLDQVPEAGALVIVTFPKPKGGSGFPARVFAVLP